jgi:hypothetical protein
MSPDMNKNRVFLLIYVNEARPGPLIEGVRTGLRERGAQVREITLGDDYQALLDDLAAGAVPLVIRQSL